MSTVSTLVRPHALAFSVTPIVGRLARGHVLETEQGHRCTFQLREGGRYWVCGHNFVISSFKAAAARQRAAEARAGEAQAGPGGPLAGAPAPAPESPARPTTTTTTAGGRSGVPG